MQVNSCGWPYGIEFGITIGIDGFFHVAHEVFRQSKWNKLLTRALPITLVDWCGGAMKTVARLVERSVVSRITRLTFWMNCPHGTGRPGSGKARGKVMAAVTHVCTPTKPS